MKITINNYEEYIIDFLEDSLPDDVRIEFEMFLRENPEIADEINGFENISLQPETVIFDDKNNLKKTEFSDILNCTYFEELCIRKVEGDLTDEQYNDFKIILNKEKKNQKIFQQISSTRLKPDLNIIFSEKKSLKQSNVLNRRMLWAITSVAASIVFIFVILNFINFNNNSVNTLSAKTEFSSGENIRTIKVIVLSNQNQITSNKAIIVLNDSNKTDVEVVVNDVNIVKRDNPEIENIERIETCLLSNNQIETIDFNPVIIRNNPEKLSLFEVYDYTKQYLTSKFTKKIETTEELLNNPIDLAQTAITSYNNLTESSVKLEKVYDENGNVVALNLSSEKFDFFTNKIGR